MRRLGLAVAKESALNGRHDVYEKRFLSHLSSAGVQASKFYLHIAVLNVSLLSLRKTKSTLL